MTNLSIVYEKLVVEGTVFTLRKLVYSISSTITQAIADKPFTAQSLTDVQGMIDSSYSAKRF